MAKGGARARSGPPPDPQALRRERDGDGWVTLPAEGRKGSPPKWPLRKASAMVVDEETGKATRLGRALDKREAEVWKQEWARPQAVMWERLGLELEVALYVRAVVGAESPGAPVNLRTLVKQHQESLGISLPGLQRNRWRIVDTSAAAAPPARRPPAGRAGRSRFTVVNGGAGEA